jgi:hypothetical protein
MTKQEAILDWVKRGGPCSGYWFTWEGEYYCCDVTTEEFNFDRANKLKMKYGKICESITGVSVKE